jgi:hypothetical protein
MANEPSRVAAMLQPETEQVEQAQKKRHGTGWPKGVSGNPAGRARHVLPDGRTVREAARDATPCALALLTQVINDPEQPMPLRIAAANGLIRCGHADAPRDMNFGEQLTVIVQPLAVEPRPTPGVLSHPDSRWIAATPSIADARLHGDGGAVRND